MIGCGAIGSHLAVEIQRRFKASVRLVGICDQNPQAARQLSRRLKPLVPVLPIKKLVKKSQLLIEAASASAVRELLPLAAAHRRPVLLLSTGALASYPELLRKVQGKIPVHLPSGALIGLDGVKAAALGDLRSIRLTTRKPPAAFRNAPGLNPKIRLDRLRRAKTIFQGSALAAIRAFPQNINVAVTLSLAGIGLKKTQVRIIADPKTKVNLHEVEAQGSFGRLVSRVENRPLPENPRTSRLAYSSALATLKGILQPLHIGT